MLAQITLKTSTFCGKSYQKRHGENLDALGDAGCTRCFQHRDLQRKLLLSTPKDSDAFDVVDLVYRPSWLFSPQLGKQEY